MDSNQMKNRLVNLFANQEDLKPTDFFQRLGEEISIVLDAGVYKDTDLDDFATILSSHSAVNLLAWLLAIGEEEVFETIKGFVQEDNQPIDLFKHKGCSLLDDDDSELGPTDEELTVIDLETTDG